MELETVTAGAVRPSLHRLLQQLNSLFERLLTGGNFGMLLSNSIVSGFGFSFSSFGLRQRLLHRLRLVLQTRGFRLLLRRFRPGSDLIPAHLSDLLQASAEFRFTVGDELLSLSSIEIAKPTSDYQIVLIACLRGKLLDVNGQLISPLQCRSGGGLGSFGSIGKLIAFGNQRFPSLSRFG